MCFRYTKTFSPGGIPPLAPPHTRSPGVDRMARPRLDVSDRRTRTVGVRLTSAEAVDLADRAAAVGLTTASYVRRAALGRRIRSVAVLRLGADDRRELGRIGVNLNQLARAMNAGVPAPPGTRETVERIGELVAELLAHLPAAG